MRISSLSGILFIAIFLISCEKSVDQPFLEKDSARETRASAKSKLSYGSRELYMESSTSATVVSPVIKPNREGTFKSIPEGLALNPITGAINVNESLSGMTYKVFYVSTNGMLIDSTPVVISGIDYEDAILTINNNLFINKADILSPIYNSDKSLKLPRKFVTTESDNIFDETDLNNDGKEDIAGVVQETLLLNKKTGEINLKASIRAGMFGSSKPSNGETKDFTIYYRMNDNSKRALNKISLRVYYFRTKADIPESLIKIMNDRKKISQRVMAGVPTSSTSMLTEGDVMTGDIIDDTADFAAKMRPPMIIIIGS
jgi:hypothetical protein